MEKSPLVMMSPRDIIGPAPDERFRGLVTSRSRPHHALTSSHKASSRESVAPDSTEETDDCNQHPARLTTPSTPPLVRAINSLNAKPVVTEDTGAARTHSTIKSTDTRNPTRTAPKPQKPDLPSWTHLRVADNSDTEDDEGEGRAENSVLANSKHTQSETHVTSSVGIPLDPKPQPVLNIPPSFVEPPIAIRNPHKTPEYIPAAIPVTIPANVLTAPAPAPAPPTPAQTPAPKPTGAHENTFEGVMIVKASPRPTTAMSLSVAGQGSTPRDVLMSAHGLGREARSLSVSQSNSGLRSEQDVNTGDENATPPPSSSSAPSSPPATGSIWLADEVDGTDRDDGRHLVPLTTAKAPVTPTNETPPRKLTHKNAKQSSFIGVVITTPSPNKNKTPQNRTPNLVSALAQAFEHNQVPLSAVDSRTHMQATVVRATAPRRPRITLPPRAITQADIDEHLGKRVAPVRVPRPGGRGWADAEAWEKFMDREAVERRLKVCLRFVEKEGKDTGGNAKCEAQRAFAVQEKSRTEGFIERLEKTFGSGSLYRGTGPKPKVGQKRQCTEDAKAVRPQSSRSDTSVSGRSTVNGIVGTILGKRARSAGMDSEPGEDSSEEPRYTRARIDGAMTPIGADTMRGWTTALQKLIKGKTAIEKEELRALSAMLDQIDGLKDTLELEDLTETRVRESVENLSRLEEMPFEDDQGLRAKATLLTRFWSMQVI